MYIERHALAITTNSSGAATVYSPTLQGRVVQVTYVPHASSPLDTGADFTVTEEDTGNAILTITNVGTSTVSYAPRQATHSVAGAAALYAGGGSAVLDLIAVKGRIKLVVAQGGNTLQGTLYVWMG